jgi:predicted nucleic acid-binding protein
MPLLVDTAVGDRLLISAMTIAELYAGVREGAERVALDDFIRAFEIVQIDNEIAVKGGLYRRDYGKTHGTGIGDAIIAATAELSRADLVTLNKKHFPMFSSVIVPYQKP